MASLVIDDIPQAIVNVKVSARHCPTIATYSRRWKEYPRPGRTDSPRTGRRLHLVPQIDAEDPAAARH